MYKYVHIHIYIYTHTHIYICIPRRICRYEAQSSGWIEQLVAQRYPSRVFWFWVPLYSSQPKKRAPLLQYGYWTTERIHVVPGLGLQDCEVPFQRLCSGGSGHWTAWYSMAWVMSVQALLMYLKYQVPESSLHVLCQGPSARDTRRPTTLGPLNPTPSEPKTLT